MRRMIAVLLGAMLLPTLCPAGEPAPTTGGASDKESYALGYEFGSNLKRQGVPVDAGVLLGAIREGLEGKTPALAADDIRETLLQLRKRMAVVQNQRFQQLAAENLEKGRAFLEANRAKEGVTVLPSGLQYRVLRDGDGRSPKATDMITVHYRGTMIDGREFDSSHTRGAPETLLLQGTMRGWQEALPLMKTGSKWQLFVPADLAYGMRAFGRIAPGSALVFEIELLDVSEGIPQAAKAELLPDDETGEETE